MVYFQTKIPNLGKFIAIWNIFRTFGIRILSPFGTFCAHLEHFAFNWHILFSFGTFYVHLVHFYGFGIMHQEKSGNPCACDHLIIVQSSASVLTVSGLKNVYP
jgi:hypothetical protein